MIADEAKIRDGVGSVAWLLSCGFCYVGAWDGTMPRIHRASFLHRQPGVYAFTLNERAAYIGMASELHSRLRNYRNRVLRPRESLPLRLAHKGILATISAGQTVSVYAFPIAAQNGLTIGEVEADLIRRAKPRWNGNGWERRTSLSGLHQCHHVRWQMLRFLHKAGASRPSSSTSWGSRARWRP